MKKKIVAILLAFVLAGIGTGCAADALTADESAQQPYQLALVAGITNNNPILDTGIQELALLPTQPNASYSFILADGNPNLICQGTIPDFQDRHYTDEMMERVYASIRADLSSQLDSTIPDDAEIDLSAATSLAVRALRANQVEGQKNLLVYYCSGISTCGQINMIDAPLSDLDVEASVETLSGMLDFDLTGIDIDVIWYCCGETTGTQPALSSEEKNTLQTFYESLFQSLGAESVTFRDNIPLDGSYSFSQQVSVMPTAGTVSGLQTSVIAAEDLAEESMGDSLGEGTVIVFDDMTLSFQPDSAALKDEAAALEALQSIVEYMKADPDFTLLICGTTTSAGEEKSCRDFSERRAETVRDLLVSSGVAESQIQILGCGYSSCLYVPDRASDGTLDETIAPKNRSTVLLDANSTAASTILASLDAE